MLKKLPTDCVFTIDDAESPGHFGLIWEKKTVACES